MRFVFELDSEMFELFERKARDGNPGFAIAYALLELARAQQESTLALDRMGLNNLSPAGPPGALESLAMEVANLATSVDNLGAIVGGN